MKKIAIISLVSFLILGWLFKDFFKDKSELGDDYYYLSDFEAMDVGCPYGAIVYKAKRKNCFNKILVYKVKNAISNNEFVLVVQNLEKDSIYYIIEKKVDGLYGPYNLNEFLYKQKELGVPQELSEALDSEN
jgi:hypothetical protein